jgi:glyoxylase-like metal-dependent hydrolase (beta-lactamase superfamily II)
MSIVSLWMKPRPMQVDEIVKDGQVLPILGGLRVVETVGHTPGHISLYAPKLSVLFPGDSMISDDKGLQGSRPSVTWDKFKSDESVRKQAMLGARIVFPGHGPVVTDAQDKFPKVDTP